MVFIQKVKNITTKACRIFMDYFDKDLYKVINNNESQALLSRMYKDRILK
ncbi:MAG: hypothetical protein MK033_06435 [Candidatus Caenarcaniphilales bacterium]|nr:hypothetical protein [Candidatus Caenarcaniphilales bacterium]